MANNEAVVYEDKILTGYLTYRHEDEDEHTSTTISVPVARASELFEEMARLRGWRVFSVESRDGRRRVEVTL